MLIGSYAFSCYGNQLGVVFYEAMRRTEDRDVAYQRSIEIGFVCDIREDITGAAPGMAEPRQINPWIPPYEMVAPDGFKAEFLTTPASPLDKAPVRIERFGVNAQPFCFMDYLLAEPVRTVVLYGAGIPVSVPEPARYAIHKLAVSQLRPAAYPEKRRKDLAQAGALIKYLLEESPGALLLAGDAAKSRDDGFAAFVERGIGDAAQSGLIARFVAETRRR